MPGPAAKPSVNLLGVEVSSASTQIVTPTAAAASLNWQVNPPADISGNIELYGSLTGMQGYLLVDGRTQGFTNTSGSDSTQQNKVHILLRTVGLSNGPHRVQIIGSSGTFGCATSTQQITVNNTDFSSVSCDGIIETDTGDVAGLQMTGPLGIQQWTVQVKDANNTVVRSWQLATAAQTLKLAWDGKNTNNVMVSEGDYNVFTTAQTSSSSQTKQSSVRVLSTAPYALALVSYTAEEIDPSGQQADLDLGNRIKNSYVRLQALNTSNKRYLVLGPKDIPDANQQKMANKIITWLSSTVDILYICSHGAFNDELHNHAMDYTTFNDWLEFKPDSLSGKGDPTTVYLDKIMSGRHNRPFKFVFLDCCNSAGESLNGLFAFDNPDAKWASACGIYPGLGSGSVFLGWSSSIFVSFRSNGWYNRSVYFWWTANFWDLVSSYPVVTIDFGNARDQSSFLTQRQYSWPPTDPNPWDIDIGNNFYSRLVFVGDLEGVWLYQ